MQSNFETDKRRYIRYELLDYATLEPLSTGGAVNIIIVDIGLGGLQVRTRQQLALGEKCRLTVGRNQETPLQFRGEVRHCAAIEHSDLFSLGIRFTPENHEERMGIAEFVHAVFQRQCDLLAT